MVPAALGALTGDPLPCGSGDPLATGEARASGEALAAGAAELGAPEPDACGAGEGVATGNAYTAKTAALFALSLSGATVPANTMRCGGNVGEAAGAPATPGALDAPTAPVGKPDGTGSGDPDATGETAADADPTGDGGGGALGGALGVGGGDEVSCSETAIRYVLSLSPAL